MRPFYNLKVITPQGVRYQGKVVHAEVPAESGFVGVLANHAPYVTSSPGGQLEILKQDESRETYRVGAGFFEIAQNEATFLTQTFDAPSPSGSDSQNLAASTRLNRN